jgi:hypothetical protein
VKSNLTAAVHLLRDAGNLARRELEPLRSFSVLTQQGRTLVGFIAPAVSSPANSRHAYVVRRSDEPAQPGVLHIVQVSCMLLGTRCTSSIQQERLPNPMR